MSKKKDNCSFCANGGGLPLRNQGFSRRHFVKIAGTGLVASFFADVINPRILFGQTVAPNVSLKNSAKNCIFIFLTGAPSQIDTWDLKEGSWTPTDFAPTSYLNGAVRFPQGLLPQTAAQINNLSFIRSGLAWAAVHSLAQTWTQIARSPTGATGAIAPHIGSVVSLESQVSRTSSDVLPAFIALDSGGIPSSGYFPATYSPFNVQTAATGLSTLKHPDGATRFSTRWNFLHALDTNRITGALAKKSTDMNDLYNGAKALMDDPNVDALFSFSDADHAKYGSSTFGDGLLVAKQLIAGRKGARFIQVSYSGWDTHSDIYNKSADISLYSQSAEFDPAFGALMSDLATTPGATAGKTLLDETLVVVIGEFGRTTGPITSQGGRDHNLRFAAMIAGGGVKGGRVIGKTDAAGDQVLDYGWAPGRDIRPEDIASTIYSALGIDYTTMRSDDPLNRGFEYVPGARLGEYQPIDELF